MQNAILLQSGEFYSYTNPEKNIITIEDIALSLSNICRFGGQVKEHYSVAQHSVYVSYAIEEQYAMDGLMHDAAEAFLGDIPTPFKNLLSDYKIFETQHEADIFARFGLDYPMVDAVKVADKAVFCAEVRDMKPKHTHWDGYCNIIPFEDKIIPWSNKVAYRMFLDRFFELLSKRKVH